MKRVALCMRGAISKTFGAFFCENDLYRQGEYIDYVSCRNSIFRHIIFPNSNEYEFYIFCHSWNKELEDDIINIYQPKKYLFEDNRIYNNEISSLCKSPSDFGGISQALTIKKSIELKEEYELQNDITFDIVISYRYDVLLWKNMDLCNYCKLYNTIYTPNYYNGLGDFHFVMDNENSSKFKYLYDSLYNGNEHSCHRWIKHYVNTYLNLNMCDDEISPGIHQEVMRKIQCSLDSNHISIEELNSYKTN
jgi:hypothetical protein